MYGGDEVSAIVLDLGSHSCKAGYAGEDAPKAVLPSVVGSVDQSFLPDVGKTGGDSEVGTGDAKGANKPTEAEKSKLLRKLYTGVQGVGFRRDYMEIVPALKDGLIADWDIVESIWDHTLRERLMIDPKEHPMLLAEPSFNTPQHREKVVELMFEKYGIPALFLAKNAVLTSFASGRATSLVVDWSDCTPGLLLLIEFSSNLLAAFGSIGRVFQPIQHEMSRLCEHSRFGFLNGLYFSERKL